MPKSQMELDLEAAKAAPIDQHGRPISKEAMADLVTEDDPTKETNFEKGQKKTTKKEIKKEEEYTIEIVDEQGNPTGELFTKEGEEIKASKKEEVKKPKVEIKEEVKDELTEARLLKEQNDILKEALDNVYAQQVKEAETVEAEEVNEFDPFSTESVNAHIQKQVEKQIGDRLKPLEKTVYKDAFERSEKAVQDKYGDMYVSAEDAEAVVAIRQKYSGMSHEDAFKIYNHDRMQENSQRQLDKSDDLTATTTMAGGATGTRHLETKSKTVQLTKEELIAARLTGCTPEEYLENKAQVHSR